MEKEKGFKHHSPKTKQKIGKTIKKQWEKLRETTFFWRVETNKGVFYGDTASDTEEQAESQVRKAFEMMRLFVSGLKILKGLPPGRNNTFFLPPEGTRIIAGHDLWVAAGREKEYYRKLAEGDQS